MVFFVIFTTSLVKILVAEADDIGILKEVIWWIFKAIWFFLLEFFNNFNIKDSDRNSLTIVGEDRFCYHFIWTDLSFSTV